MQLKSSLLVALVAGSVSSVAMGQQQVRVAPVTSIQTAQVGHYAMMNGRKYPISQGTGAGDAVPVYASGALALYTQNIPGASGDHIMFSPGPGTGGPVTLTAIDYVSFGCSSTAGWPGGTIDLVLEFYDTYDGAATPVNSVPLYQLRIGFAGPLPALTAGQFYTNTAPIDISALNMVIPDGEFACVQYVVDHATADPITQQSRITAMMGGFANVAPTVGTTENTFMLDANNNGVFENTELYVWNGGAWGSITLRLSGNNTAPQGACCLPDASCIIGPAAQCTALLGTYQGDNSACTACGPVPTGRCCKPDGSCAVISHADCNTAFGVYGGDNSTCGTCVAFGYVEGATDAGELPGTAAVVSGPGNTALTNIYGNLVAGDTDMYKIDICDRTVFTASVVGGAGGSDTQMFLFDSTGKGLAMDDDNAAGAESNVSGAFVVANGVHYIALDLYNRDPIDAASVQIWANTNPGAAYFPEWAPNGVPASADNIVTGWTGTPGGTAAYNITLTGACFISASCYANCDGSTASPLLTANDFQCFLNKYAQNDPYANCDGSTAVPVLTANDFQCFLNKYAVGCGN